MIEIHSDRRGSASDRLHALGLELPGLGDSSKYVNHRTLDSSIYISGQLPYQDGELLGTGIVGRDVDVQTARGLARHAALNALAAAVQAVGDQTWTGSGSCRCWSSWPARRSSVCSRGSPMRPVTYSSRCWARTDGTRAPRSVSPGCR
jgi:YjgF/chorismate_mutase-like, putative endoribonuclease